MEKFIESLANILSQKTGLCITADHVHKASRREYYIPEAEAGKPLVLHHYRGPFFLEIPGEDWEKLEKGILSPEDYVETSKWHYGYYWGGGSMIGGGYFRPLEEGLGINEKERISRFMRVIQCEGKNLASGFYPTEETCMRCMVTDCPFSNYKGNKGNYAGEIPRKDARVTFLTELEKQIRGPYVINILCSSSTVVAKDEVILCPSTWSRSFRAYVGDELVRYLLYNPECDVATIAKEVKVFVAESYYEGKRILIKDEEDFERALREFKVIESWEKWENRGKNSPKKSTLWERVKAMFSR